MPKHTKADTMRKYLRKHPDTTLSQFIEVTGTAVHGGHFSTIRQKIRKELEKEQKANKLPKNWLEIAAKTDPRRPTPPKPIIVTTDDFSDLHEMNNIVLQLKDTEKKMDEYRYRCWKLEGEKFGYTQRLLEENKK